MDFALSEKEKDLISRIAMFARKELPENFVPATLIVQDFPDFEFEVSMSKKLAQQGWLVMSWPKEYGGGGATVFEQTIFDMETSYWGVPGAWMGVSGTQWVGPCIMLFGSDEQKKQYLPLIASGDRDGYWCTGYSEPNSGSDLASLQTRAVKKGDKYIINGQKVWTSIAHHARWCWLMVRTNPDAPKKHQGLSLFIVDMKSPGITVRPLPNYYGVHHFNEVFFDNVEVPAVNLVGQENRGWYHLMQALSFERRGLAPMIYGQFKKIMEELVAYVSQNKSNGKILSQDQIVRYKLAELAIEMETLRLFAFQLAWTLTKGTIPIYESSRNKVTVDNIMKHLAFDAADMLGIFAQADPDSRWARLKGVVQGTYLGFPGNKSAAGTEEVEKSIIAQFKLGLPKSY